jgi:hypothetical protein
MSSQTPKAHWYSEKIMWLVVGLPIAAVLAGFTSLWLVITRPDHEIVETPVPHALGSNSVTPPER